MAEIWIGDNCFICSFCDTKLQLDLPMPVKMFAETGKKFAEEHEHCVLKNSDI